MKHGSTVEGALGETSATPRQNEAESFEHHLMSGGELLRRSRLQDAAVEFQKALSVRPGDGKALGLLGLTYFRLADYAQAQDIYERLIEANPSDASLRLNLGLVYLRLGEAERAINELERCRELDPGMAKAVGYLGLSYARAGRYLDAYRAFVQSGQEDLAGEMEPNLTPEEIASVRATADAGTGALPPPSARRNGARATREPEPAVQRPAGTGAEEGSPAVSDEEAAFDATDMAVEEAQEPPAPAAESAELPAASADERQAAAAPEQPVPASATEASAPAAPEQAADAGPSAERDRAGSPAVEDGTPEEITAAPGRGISAAVEAAAPSQAATAAATRTAAGHQPPIPLTEFATARLVRPDDGDHTFEISAGGVLIVRVHGRILSRTEGVIVSGGDLAYEPATRRVRGKNTDEPLGGSGPMFSISGDGHLVASPLQFHFAAITLDDDVLYLREDLVFAFEEELRWENGHVPGADLRIGVLQFRGRGSVALRTRRPCLGVKLSPARTLYVDTDVLAGWIGRVVPRVVAPAAGGESSALFVECSGEGVVLLEDQDPQEAADDGVA